MSKRQRSKKRQQGPNIRKPWPWVLAGGVLVLVIAGLMILREPDTSQLPEVPVTVAGGPHLEIDREHIDFGDVPVNQMVNASFKLSNTGDHPLVLQHSPVAEVVDGC